MGNVLTKNTPDNTRYTEFENNQVLTADQLNDLFRYLDIQTRLTRTRGIGVGIICGLEIGITNDKTIVLSAGTAITTDGDLLNVPADLVLDQYIEFKDTNSVYDYFHLDSGEQIPLFELVSSKTARVQGKAIGDFDADTNSALKDYVGILYLEDYNNDADLCTGVDCDNKGIECVRDLKVLIAHKDKIAELLKSVPKMNQQYFALEDIVTQRVMIKNTISKFDELRGAFATALGIKDTLKANLKKAYEVCKGLVEDDLDSSDPVTAWNDLIEEHFKLQGGIYVQYIYDFARDLSYAYNELRETLFNDNSMCCPPVELFPKHVMLGLVKSAAVKKPPVIVTGQPIPRIKPFEFIRTIRFDIGLLIKRFNTVHIDIEYRHYFYGSPITCCDGEHSERIRFCFKRMDAMIRNFKIPTAEELQTVNNIKIIPGLFEERLLGERTIPFYYKYNRSQPINAYWNFKANTRKSENNIHYYFSEEYSNSAQVRNPLQFNLLPYSFFRIEGHIGYKYQEVERILNKIIDENNLPINLVTVQVERDIRTIPNRDWFFPQIHLYEQITRNNFIDHLNQAELVHTKLKEETNDDIDKVKINLAIDNFAKARQRVVEQKPMTANNFNIADFSKDVSDAIKSATEIKVQTQKFAFSNTAAPHDFLINTDLLIKADLLKDLLDQQIERKKQGLVLGNFMKKNPGLEHAAGVLRGGTFVIVYTSNDDKVVADFMLPYASVDVDIVVNPPVVKPLPLPVNPKFELPKVFEKVPPYKKFIDDGILTINDKIKFFDDRFSDFNTKFGQKVIDLEASRKLIDEKANTLDKLFGDKIKIFEETKKNFDQKTIDLDNSRKMLEGKANDLDKLFNDKFKFFDQKFSALEDSRKNLDSKADNLDKLFGDKIKIFEDVRKNFDQKTVDLETSRKMLEGKANDLDKLFSQKANDLDNSRKNLDEKIKDVDVTYTRKIQEFENKLDYQGKIFNNIATVIPTRKVEGLGTSTGVVLGGRNLEDDAIGIRKIAKELESTTLSANDRLAKESQMVELAKRMNEAVSGATSLNKEEVSAIKGIMFDVNEAADKITNPNLKATHTDAVKKIGRNVNRFNL